jgi:hypothetical protein
MQAAGLDVFGSEVRLLELVGAENSVRGLSAELGPWALLG